MKRVVKNAPTLKEITSWKDLKVDDSLIFYVDDFDGKALINCKVVEVSSDHALAVAEEDENEKLYIDEDTQDLFFYNIKDDEV